MVFSNLSGWAGSSCGASDKPAACGAADKPEEKPAACGECGNGLRFPPGQARTQGAKLADFCGAAAPQHQRGAPVNRVQERHSSTSIRPGGQVNGAKFGPRVNTCSHLFLH